MARKLLNPTGASILYFGSHEDVADMHDYRKRPSIVSARQIDESFRVDTNDYNYIQGRPGDYLIKALDGELSVCDKDIFELLYDPVELE